eukprot:snap_masked-scaffold_18-processed-gene-5.41-mRNA-1 protein AED:1.00 eAED:1.00 QI:0/-1/0/0/-1/1/1/0/103
METCPSDLSIEELELRQPNQTETRDNWTTYRGSTQEEMFEVVEKVAENRFSWRKQSSYSFSEDETNQIFGYTKKITRRCKLECVSSKNCTFGVYFNINAAFPI